MITSNKKQKPRISEVLATNIGITVGHLDYIHLWWKPSLELGVMDATLYS
jgi:hypothetical protein